MDVSSRRWKWGVWHAEDDAWLAELQRRHALLGGQQDGGGDAMQIPKRIHQIWLGPNEIPPRCVAWMKTWREHHPDWEYTLWRDADVDVFALKNGKAFREASNYGEKSDILRYEILARLGGVYVDIDMECLQPFDALVKRFAFAVGISNTACVEINNAVIAACPDHPIVLRLVDSIYKTTNKPRLDAAMLARIALMGGADVAHFLVAGSGEKTSSSSAMATIERTGPGLMTRTFMEAIGWTRKATNSRHEGFLSPQDQQRVIALPVDVLYPLANDSSDIDPQQPRAFPTQTLAVHYWQRTWQA